MSFGVMRVLCGGRVPHGRAGREGRRGCPAPLVRRDLYCSCLLASCLMKFRNVKSLLTHGCSIRVPGGDCNPTGLAAIQPAMDHALRGLVWVLVFIEKAVMCVRRLW